ncbi:MAG TPA: hypothetical protein VGK70_04780 [Thermoanaerobaculia bacterium]|jgi:hypothetical protein
MSELDPEERAIYQAWAEDKTRFSAPGEEARLMRVLEKVGLRRVPQNEKAHHEGGPFSDPKIRNSDVAIGRDRGGEISSINIAADHGGADPRVGLGRVAYATAGEATRSAYAAAARLNLTSGQWQVLAAVVRLTASYSKLQSPTTEEEIAGFARLGVRQTRRILEQLHELGLIIWQPRRGIGISMVGLPAPPSTMSSQEAES